MKRNKIIVLGSLAFDYIMSFEENFVNAVSIDMEREEYQSTITANSRVQHFGGTAGNIAYNLGLLNISEVSLLGSVGKDFETLGYKAHINRFQNIDLNVDIQTDLFTAACYIVNDKKSNQMIIFHGGALDESKNIDLRKKIINPEEYAYAINSTQSIEAMKNFANQLNDLQIPMIFDPGQITPLFSKEELLDILSKSEILIGNSFEISQVLNKTDLDEQNILNFVKAIIKTKGPNGSELILKSKSEELNHEEIPIAIPRTTVDATGAGDGYRAGILTGLILKMNLLDACRFGSILGSFVVETNGAQTQLYDIKIVKARFQKTYGYIPPELEMFS
ncbi:MAG: PfkB family carbohydrate kinase [Candidatus Hermodarchaeota archaeon]